MNFLQNPEKLAMGTFINDGTLVEVGGGLKKCDKRGVWWYEKDDFYVTSFMKDPKRRTSSW